jgi:hypothetical protein
VVLEQAQTDTRLEFDCIQRLVEKTRDLEGKLHEVDSKYQNLDKDHTDALEEYEKWIDIKKREEEVFLSGIMNEDIICSFLRAFKCQEEKSP